MHQTRLVLLTTTLAIAGCGVGVDETTSTTTSSTATSTSTAGTSAASCTDTWSSYAGAFFSVNCASCHRTQYQTQASVKASLSRVTSEIQRGSMPEGRVLAATEKARVLAWLACGAP